MARKAIFIGSASERTSRSLAEAVAEHVTSRPNLRALPWWQAFPAGDVTLDRLSSIAREVDGAVFLLRGEDRSWYRQRIDKVPRDNVLLEYGIFVARLGRARSLVLTDKDTRLPTDLSGIVHQSIIDDYQAVAQKASRHFERELEGAEPTPPMDSIPLVVDPVLAECLVTDPPPVRWHHRDLYVGLRGAKGWLAAVSHDYIPLGDELELHDRIRDSLDNVDVRTFVSLGPGDGRIDREIVQVLQDREPLLRYIPVDISEGLLCQAIKLVSPGTNVPVGILADFEEPEGVQFIRRQLRRHGAAPKLFALLGGTLGNLDASHEASVLEQLRRLMEESDSLILHVAVMGPNWSFDLDPRARHDGYHSGQRRYVATGVARRRNLSVGEVIDRFEQVISFVPGRSAVPNAKTIHILDGSTGQARVICSVRRYHWESFLDWLRKMGFDIRFEGQVIADDGIVCHGVVRLERRFA